MTSILISQADLTGALPAHFAFGAVALVVDQRWFAASLILFTSLMALSCALAISARRKLAEQSAKLLGLSEERYRQIVESAQEGIATISADAVCTLANEEFARMLGRPLEQVLNKHYTEWVVPELYPTCLELIARKREGLTDRYEMEVPTPVGLKYLSVLERPMPSNDGRYAGYLVTLTDLTERKAVENSMIRREADYRHLFESSPTAQVLVDRETFQIYNVNRTACELFGYDRDEFSRVTVLDLQTPEGVDSSRRLFANPMVSGPMVRQYRRNGGAIFDTVVYAHDQEFEGRPCRLLHVIDQTEQVRAANKLKESQQTLALAQEIAQIGSLQILLPSVPGEPLVRIWSEELCRLFGIDRETANSQNLAVLDFVHPDDAQAFAGRRKQIVTKGVPTDGEHRIVRTDGSVRYVRTAARLLGAGQRTVIATVQDITEYKALQEQLEQAQRLDSIGRLAGGVAHDFNNLLTVINGYSKLILKKLDPSSSLYHDVQLIAEAGQEAAELTRRLLAFGRKQVLKPATLDLNEVIRDASTLLDGVVGDDIRIFLRFCDSPALTRADLVQMNQILLNLATNCRDAMPRGGSVTFETSQLTLDNSFVAANPGAVAGAHIQMSVIDTGAGMDSATQGRIFEPFFTTKHRTGGTGLGLATVYGIVKQSGGSIHVKSELGKGTRFDIYLPALPAEAALTMMTAPSREITELPLDGTGCEVAGKLILLVEDRAEVRRYVAGILNQNGYRVVEAQNGTEALAAFDDIEEDIDLLLTDVAMPGMTGSELVDRITALSPAKPIRVLFMSGYAESKLDAGRIHPGVIGLLEKPFSPDELLRHVSLAISTVAVTV